MKIELGVLDRWTDGPTDGQTPAYREARTHLKRVCTASDVFLLLNEKETGSVKENKIRFLPSFLNSVTNQKSTSS